MELAPTDVRAALRAACPELSRRTDALAGRWLERLNKALEGKGELHYRPKQVNDPVWGTIELHPWEVALIDTTLLQRLRGVRQLGLAHLVFPSVCHDRFEHILGVVGAVDTTLKALDQQIARWNQDNHQLHLPPIADSDRHALRLAALFHDLGHGPFSHALEPVLEKTAILRPPDPYAPDGKDWRSDLTDLHAEVGRHYQFNENPQISELIPTYRLDRLARRILPANPNHCLHNQHPASDRLAEPNGRA